MTVSTEVNQAAYTGNGVTTVFPYAFRILNSSNLTVTRINLLEVETVLTLGTDYTVSGAGSYNGGSVTLPQPLPAGYSLVIERDLAAVQETDLRNQGTFFAEVHEDVFDYLTMLVQQVSSWLGLALRRPTIRSKFYDAKQYRIANLGDPINSQDAVNKRTLLKSLADLSTDGSSQFVMQILGGADGYKYIGRCQDIATLRTTVPSVAGQKIEVVSYYSDWAGTAVGPSGGGEFYYDASDITSADDGIFVFVTAGGARWKRKLKNEVYNLSMGGVRTGHDATAVLKGLVSKIVERYKAVTTPGTVPINFGNGSIEVDPGTYIISSTVQLYTVTTLVALGDVTFDARSVTTGQGIFKISNDGLPVANKPKYLTTGPVLNGARGTISIVGDKKVPGIAMGNTADDMADCRDHLIDNVSVSYVTSFININGSFDTYLAVVSNFRGYGCSLNGIIFSQTSFANAGERMQFNEITLGGVDGNAFSIAQPGVMISISNASFDFISGNIINLSSNVGFAMIDIDGGSHAEAFDGFVATSAQASNKITWNGGTILPTSRSRNTLDNYAGRTLFSGRLQSFQLRDVHILSSFPPANSSVFLGAAFDPATRAQFSVTGLFSTHGWSPSRFDIANLGSDFSGETLGATLSVANQSLVKFMKPASVTNWISGVTCTIVDPGDGTKALRLAPITPGVTTNYLAVTTVKYIPVLSSKSIARLWAVCQILNAVLRLRIELSMDWYNSDKELITTTASGGVTDLVTNANITTLPGYSADPAVNGQRKIASLANAQLAPPEAAYMKPVWLISGIDQTININELCTYIV